MRRAGGQKIARTSYYQGQKSKGKSPFVKRAAAQPSKRLAKFIDIVVLVVVAAGLVYSLILNHSPRVLASSSVYHPAGVYQLAAAKAMQGWRSTNKVTFDELAVTNTLKSQFPEISSATVELPIIGQRPTIRLDISAPAFFLKTAKSTFILNGEGRVVSEATSTPNIKNLATIDDQSGYKADPGDRVLSASNISFIRTVMTQCSRARVPVAGLILPSAAQELDLRTADQGYYVKFYLGGDPMVQTGQFLAARHQFSQGAPGPSQYLDVRIAGKIFYK